jgi:hypothetical protein
MDTLATHAELLGHLGDRETIPDDAEHGVVTLLHFAELPKHWAASRSSRAKAGGG